MSAPIVLPTPPMPFMFNAIPPAFFVGMIYKQIPQFESNNMKLGIGRFVAAAAVDIHKLVLLLETKVGATRPAFAVGIA